MATTTTKFVSKENMKEILTYLKIYIDNSSTDIPDDLIDALAEIDQIKSDIEEIGLVSATALTDLEEKKLEAKNITLNRTNGVVEFDFGDTKFFAQAVDKPDAPQITGGNLYILAGTSSIQSSDITGKVGTTYYKINEETTATPPTASDTTGWTSLGSASKLTFTNNTSSTANGNANYLGTSSSTGVTKYVHLVNINKGLVSDVKTVSYNIKRKLNKPTVTNKITYDNTNTIVTVTNSPKNPSGTSTKYGKTEANTAPTSWENSSINFTNSSGEKTYYAWAKHTLTDWIDSDPVSGTLTMNRSVCRKLASTSLINSLSSFNGWTSELNSATKNAKTFTAQGINYDTNGDYYAYIAIPSNNSLTKFVDGMGLSLERQKVVDITATINGNQYKIYGYGSYTGSNTFTVTVQ